MEETPINHIWKYREKAGLRQKHVAYLLGHTDGTQYSKWESGKKLPSLQNALKLSHILQIPVELLLVELYRNLGKEVEERQKSLPREVQKRSNTEVLISEPNSQK